MQITVTLEDVVKAREGQKKVGRSWCCPVYQALRRHGVPVVMVWGTYYTRPNWPFSSVNFPPEVVAWIQAFDQNWNIDPPELNFEVPV